MTDAAARLSEGVGAVAAGTVQSVPQAPRWAAPKSRCCCMFAAHVLLRSAAAVCCCADKSCRNLPRPIPTIGLDRTSAGAPTADEPIGGARRAAFVGMTLALLRQLLQAR